MVKFLKKRLFASLMEGNTTIEIKCYETVTEKPFEKLIEISRSDGWRPVSEE